MAKLNNIHPIVRAHVPWRAYDPAEHRTKTSSSECHHDALTDHMRVKAHKHVAVCANTEGRGSMYLIQAIPTNLNNHAGPSCNSRFLASTFNEPAETQQISYHSINWQKHNTLRPPAISNEVSRYQFHTDTKQWTICPFSERQYLLVLPVSKHYHAVKVFIYQLMHNRVALKEY